MLNYFRFCVYLMEMREPNLLIFTMKMSFTMMILKLSRTSLPLSAGKSGEKNSVSFDICKHS